MSAADNLRAAQALIDTPDKWTQGYYARDKDGAPVEATSRDAVCFCMLGACTRAKADDQYIYGATKALVTLFNDDPKTTHRKVMNLFKKAIALAEAGAK